MGVIVGDFVGSGVRDGVYVKVGGPELVGVKFAVGKPEDGMFVGVNTSAIVGVLVIVETRPGVLDGVGDSAANPVGSAEPKTGMDTRKVRALAETIVSGSIGTIGIIGS